MEESEGGCVCNCGEGGEAVVLPWPRASRDMMPAFGTRALISLARHAKDRPEEPAPWWVTNRGPDERGGLK